MMRIGWSIQAPGVALNAPNRALGIRPRYPRRRSACRHTRDASLRNAFKRSTLLAMGRTRLAHSSPIGLAVNRSIDVLLKKFQQHLHSP